MPIKNNPASRDGRRSNSLDLEQNVPTKRRRGFDHKIGKHAGDEPFKARVHNRLAHFREFLRIVIDPVKQADRDCELNDGEEDFFHEPKCFFHFATEF